MSVSVSPREIHDWIEELLEQRPNIGLRKGIVNMFFVTPNPFDPRARRNPKTGFLVGTILFAASLGFFCYFSFAP